MPVLQILLAIPNFRHTPMFVGFMNGLDVLQRKKIPYYNEFSVVFVPVKELEERIVESQPYLRIWSCGDVLIGVQVPET